MGRIPKGPIGPWLPGLLPLLDQRCRKRRCFMLKIEPDENWDPQSRDRLMEAGFTAAFQTIQPPRTIHVDLTPSEDEILANMKQKTRYNIRLASRRGVRVRAWSDLDQFAQMMAETAERDAFGLAYDLFHPKGGCELFVAEFEGSPLAAVMVFRRGRRAWYLYGASHKAHREKMPTYLLQRCVGPSRPGVSCMICGVFLMRSPSLSKRNSRAAAMASGACIASSGASEVKSCARSGPGIASTIPCAIGYSNGCTPGSLSDDHRAADHLR